MSEEKQLIQAMITERMSDEMIEQFEGIWMMNILNNSKKYKVISSVIYNTNLQDIGDEELEEIYVNNIDLLISNDKKLYKELNKDNGKAFYEFEEDAEKYKESLYNHFGLALEQKKFISKNIDSLNAQLEKAETNVENIQNIKGKIYTEFVTILGIFTTIIFAVFGGFQGLGLIGMNINDTPVSKMIMFLSLMMIGIGFLIFLSYNAVSKLTKLDLSSCSCTEKSTCKCQISVKHPTLYYSSLFFLSLFLISCAFHIFKFQNLDFTMSGDTVVAILIGIIPIGISIYLYCTRPNKI